MWYLNNLPAPRNPFSGWITVDGTQYPPDWPHDELVALGLEWVEPTKTKEQLLAELANLRWLETEFFEYDGVLTQANQAIAVVDATLSFRNRNNVDPAHRQTWKLSDGEFRQWDEQDIELFGFAIAAHIQECFNKEARITEVILASEDPSDLDIYQMWSSS